MGETVKCARCGESRPPLGFAPVPTDLGQKIGAEICRPCWDAWLTKQTQIINHFGLDVSNPDTHGFLFDNMKAFFFVSSDLAQIDTSQEGKVNW
jgi:Fe-S cluster biosynthesis and repair protein YggX